MILKIFCILIASVAIGVLFSSPRRSLLTASLIACAGFAVKEWLLILGASIPEASFGGAFFVAQGAEFLARQMKVPSVVLSIPGVIPLVPGSVAYAAVIHLVRGREVSGLQTGIEALLAAFGIASGLLLAKALSRKFLAPNAN